MNRPDRSRSNRGTASLELVLLAPVLVMGMLLVVWCGRVARARGDADLAAARGARAGSMAAGSRMTGAAQRAASETLALNGAACDDASVGARVTNISGDSSSWVTVDVRCSAGSRGLLPVGARVIRATAASPIDVYRVP